MLNLAPDREVDAVHPWARLRHFDWDRAQVVIVAGFHLLVAFTVLFAPVEQVVTEGTLPVFDLAGRAVWAPVFAVAGVSAALLARKVTLVRQLATWLTVMPLGFTWTGAFAIAVIQGRGSAIGLIVWPTLLAAWAISAVRIALHSDPTGG